MHKFLLFIMIFLTGEIIANLVFIFILNRFMSKDTENIRKTRWIGILKGLLERFILFLGMINGITMVLPLFGALKIGTRFESDKESRVSNDYFLIGNLLSVLFVIFYLLLFNHLRTIL